MKPLCLKACVTLVCLAAATSAVVEPACGRTILLVDDHDVLYRSGTVRVLHPATRHPKNPLILQDKPWEVAIAWTSIHRDAKTGKYQLWYQAYAGKRAGDKRLECVVCYAE